MLLGNLIPIRGLTAVTVVVARCVTGMDSSQWCRRDDWTELRHSQANKAAKSSLRA